MPRYVFFTKEIEPISARPEQVYNILRDTIPYWKYYFPEQSQYVIDHCSHIEAKIERNYARDSYICKVVGSMTEKDYMMYILKY